jgi:hypothetical protein
MHMLLQQSAFWRESTCGSHPGTGRLRIETWKIMKMLRCNLLLSAFWLSAASAAWGQSNVYSINIVGYVNLMLFPGDNLIASQLGTTNDTLNNVLAAGVADGSTLSKWDPLANRFLPTSTYDAATASWSINYSLTYGEGALLHSPASATNTFVGEVDPALVDTSGGGTISFANWHPNYASGLYLLSCPVPLGNASFAQVVGRDPLNGEWVETLDASTQTYSITTFHGGTGWDNGDPTLAVGQAAFFDLDPVAVPEPATFALAGLGFATFLAFRRRGPLA